MVDFSVIIATYNRADYLRECLNSLVRQTYKNFETIIVDDGSTDNTKSVVNEFIELLIIKYIKIPNSGYPAIPRNIGATNASAEWLCFLDSDDKCAKNKFKNCALYLKSYDVIYHKLKYFGSGKPFYRITIPSRQVKYPVFIDLMTKGNSIPLSGSFVKKKIFLQANGFDESVSLAAVEDYDLWLKISLITDKFKFINKTLGLYRIHSSNITEESIYQIKKINAVYEKYLPLLKASYHKEAKIIKDYYSAIVYERMKDYKEATRFYKQALASHSSNLKIKSLIRLLLLKFKRSKKISYLL